MVIATIIQKTSELKDEIASLIGPPEACSPMPQGWGAPTIASAPCASAAPEPAATRATTIAQSTLARPTHPKRTPIACLILPSCRGGFAPRLILEPATSPGCRPAAPPTLSRIDRAPAIEAAPAPHK